MSEESPDRTDSSVFVHIHVEGDSLNERGTVMELGRVPLVGEQIYLAADHCWEVVQVVHLADRTIKKFPRSAHQREYPLVGSVCAFVVCKDDAFAPDLIPVDYR